jgi:hypothetical protein
VIPDKELASTDKAVTIEEPRGIIRSVGLTLDNNAKTLKLKSSVQGTLQPQALPDLPSAPKAANSQAARHRAILGCGSFMVRFGFGLHREQRGSLKLEPSANGRRAAPICPIWVVRP